MNYEKRYNEALSRAKYYYNKGKTVEFANYIVSDIFPELKESEDDKIRKDLINFLCDIWHLGKNADFDKWDKADCSNWIAWLQEQGNKFIETNVCTVDLSDYAEEYHRKSLM